MKDSRPLATETTGRRRLRGGSWGGCGASSGCKASLGLRSERLPEKLARLGDSGAFGAGSPDAVPFGLSTITKTVRCGHD
jgi:hypothetical protein